MRWRRGKLAQQVSGVHARHKHNDLARWISLRVLKALGWQIVGRFPDLEKYVIIGAPHTSNWDFAIAMLYMYASGERFNWIGKASLFRWPLGWLARRLGGIPVVRERRENFVAQVVASFERAGRLVLVIAPEGTRKQSPYWKSGFYYMALGAKAPVVMGFIDYRKRQIGMGPMLNPSGDLAADFVSIRAFYLGVQGLRPQRRGELNPLGQPGLIAGLSSSALTEKQEFFSFIQ